jgi:hypothetical protein
MALLQQLSFLVYHNMQGVFLLGAFILIALSYTLVPSRRRANLPVHSTHSEWNGSWKDSIDYLRDSPGVLKSGYEKVRRT